MNRASPSIVIAHDFAETYGGAERIIAEVADEFPEAPFWSILGRRSVARRMSVGDRFHTLLPERDRILRHYRWLAPLFPALVAGRPLPHEPEVLVTSSYAFAHGFRTRNRAPQLCFCYSPLRFAWTMTDGYATSLPAGRLAQAGFAAFAAAMRAADRRAARGVTRYVAESRYVADQIERFYGRPVDAVVHPPVDCGRFHPDNHGGHDGYFLFCGRLVEPYKRPSLVIDAFRRLPHRRLVVAGDGPARPELEARAGPNVDFVGQLSDDELVPVMQRCAAAIFPSRDDFGLVPVEVMACGRPVVAYAAGGALETIVPGKTGEFFGGQTTEALVAALNGFEPDAYDSGAIRAHAEAWDRPRFRERMREEIGRTRQG